MRIVSTVELYPPREVGPFRAVLDVMMAIAVGVVLTGAVQNSLFANPQGGTVVEGTARIEESGNRLDVHQSTERAIIDWRSFSIGANEITQFHQPSAGAIALNRVTGADPSHILGTLQANGNVFLVNPNGILFGPGSRVDVAGLVATTTDIRNRDFLAGTMEFSLPSPHVTARVANEGEITVAESGFAALVAPHVRNAGVITAPLGRVTLGAAEAFAVDLYGDQLVAFRVGVRGTPEDPDGAPVEALVENQGRIFADGGTVTLAARNIDAVVRNVINTQGMIQANALERRNGTVILKAVGPGAIGLSGIATAAGGNVEVAGDGDVALGDGRIVGERIAVTADADQSGVGDPGAGPTGGDALLTDIEIVAVRGDGATGGHVEITGDRVALRGASRIDASGLLGGGEVLIGGDFQGSGALRNAEAAIVGAEVEILADATASGNGGRVILWADGYTRFHGAISAAGGAQAGDGGFVEVSGKSNLDFAGAVNLTAPFGEHGTLLLDPVDIVISTADNTDGPNAGTVNFVDAPAAEPWNVSPAALDGVGGNISLEATNDITVTNDINLTTAGATLSLTARNNVNVNADITTNNAAITITADDDNSAVGDILFSPGVGLTTGGGAITLVTDDVDIDAVLDAGAGAVSVTASDNLTLSTNLTTNALTTMVADADNDGTGIFTIAGGVTLNTTNNTLSITANDVAITGNINSGTAATSILPSQTAQSIGLGDAAGAMTISGAELQNITATGLTIGNGTNDDINVNNITAVNSNNIAGTVTLVANDPNADVTFLTNPSTFNALSVTVDDNIVVSAALTTDTGALTFNARDDITITANIVTAGTTTLNADTDGNGIGLFSVGAATSVNTANNALSITADDVTLTGTLDSGTAATTLLVSDGGTIGLGATAGNMTISGTELQNITATGLTIGDTTNGNITVDGISAVNSDNIAGTTTLNATADNASISFSTTASTFNALAANADDRIAVNVNVSTDTGNLALDGDADNAADVNDDVAFAAGVTVTSAGSLTLDATTGNMTGAGALTLNAAGGVTLNDGLTTAGATVIDTDTDNNGAGDFTLAATKTLSTGNNTLSVTANDITLSGSVNTGTAVTSLLVSDGGTIGLGATAGNMTISGAELQNITATGLTIGDATNGSITVDGISAANSNNVAGTTTLNATADNASISFSNTASTFNALAANADDRISVNVDVTTDTGALALDGDADNAADANDDIAFAAGITVTSTGLMTLDATTGGLSGAGSLTLNSAAGLTLNDSLTTAGATTIDTDTDNNGTGDFTLAATKSLNTGNNTLTVTANDMTLSGTINTGAAATTLLVSDAGTIGLGATAGNMTITGTELQNITATGLTIGDATAGTITVDGITAVNSNNIAGTTTLNATADNASISFANTASTFNALAANADDRIAVNVNVTTDTGNLAFDGDADNAADANDDIAFAAGVTVTSAGSLTLDGTTGNMTGAGALTLNAVGGVTLNDGLTTAGATVIDTDTDNNGAGDFTLAAAKTLSTGNNTLSVTANDITLSGSVNTGTAATTLLVSDGGTIGLGATAGAMTLSGAELQNITATGLTIGDATNGSITVDGITAANSDNVAGTTTLNATADNASITFANIASTFNALAASADDRIAVNVDLTTDTGNLSLEGDADNAADLNDDIALAAGVTLSAGAALILDASTGGISAAGALTVNANNGVTLNDAYTGAGNATFDADFDSNASGDFTGTTLGVGANTLTASGVNVNTGTSLVAATATLDGAVTGTGVAVTALNITGASANMSGTVNGVTGDDAAALVNMPDAATHLFNSCTKSGCTPPAPAEPTQQDLDPVQQVATPPDPDPAPAPSEPTPAPAPSEPTPSGEAGASADGLGGSFDPLIGDVALAENFGPSLQGFLTELEDEGAEALELRQAAEALGNSQVAELTQELGEILGQFDLVAESRIPNDAFGGKARSVIPGLLEFRPASGKGRKKSPDFLEYRPPSFALFQF